MSDYQKFDHAMDTILKADPKKVQAAMDARKAERKAKKPKA